jgi:membrane dipeptidase
MRANQIILDLSHMSDRSVAQALEVWDRGVVASHSNARALVAGPRQLTDIMIKAIGRLGGVIGVSFYRGHLTQTTSASVDHVVDQFKYMAGVLGRTENLGLGSDLDGSFRVEDAAIETLSEFRELQRRLRRHFSSSEVSGIMGGNWIRFLTAALPTTAP